MDPGTEVAKHVRRKRIELAHEIAPKKKIYLDTKYWALLRDVRLGKSSDTALVALLRRLEKLVQNGLAICPLNADIFFEVFKQEDPATLTASVSLMDELSCGVCLVPMTERFPTEVFHFLESNIRGRDGVYTLDELMWTKAAYIVGFVTPDCYLLDADQNVRIQKEFADYMWTLRMTDYLNTLGVDKVGTMFSFPDISRQLNDGKMGSLQEHKSFRSLFLCEVQGILDVHKPEFASLMQYKFERDTGRQISECDVRNDKSGQMVANLIYHAIRLDKTTPTSLPTIWIGAGLHAALRWDHNRTYKKNDLFDFRHAEAAMPYCDFFFTEKALCHLVSDGNLKFPELFQCHVHHAPSDALDSLSLLR